MIKLYDNIRQLRLKRNISQDELARRTGYTSRTSISKIENGEVDLTQSKVEIFAKALGTSPDKLLGWDGVPSYDPGSGMLIIPFISQKISAGYGESELSDDCLEVRTINVLAGMIHGGNKSMLTAAEVKGDSMIGVCIYPGDTVIFSRGMIEGDGIYVLSLAGDILVKRLQFNALKNELTIISENTKYQPQTVNADIDGLRILGKVVGWIHNEI